MAMIIVDGTGKRYAVKVDAENRLASTSVNTAVQSYISRKNERAYQVSAVVNVAASEVPILYLQNDSPSLDLVITYIRCMTAGAADTNENAYFTMGIGGSRVSGGDLLTPTNVNVSSARPSEAIAYGGATPLVVSDFVEIDRNYQANSMNSYNKEGAVILKSDDAILLSHTGSTAAGIAYARFSFYLIDSSL